MRRRICRKSIVLWKHETKQVVFLNLICNGIQMVLTILMGLVGLFYFNIQFKV
jgi:hypothetical protein